MRRTVAITPVSRLLWRPCTTPAWRRVGGRCEWGHAFVQAEFVGRLIHQRRLYPTSFRQALARHLTLRHTADYAPDLVTQIQAARALQRTQDFLAVIREQVRTHESGTT